VSSTNKARTFIEERLGTYGILGTNNRVPDHFFRDPPPKPTFEFTKGNHFRFGYDDGELNVRTSGAALYWVEYGKVSRKHEGIEAELARALREIYEKHGKLSITNSGNAACRALIIEAHEAGMDVEQVTIEIEGFPVPTPDPRVPNKQIKVEWDQYQEFAEEYSSKTSNADPWVALEAYHLQFTDRPHLLTHARLNISHNGWDSEKGMVVGISGWGAVDFENATSPNRWLLSSGRVGFPQPLYWSPELMAAQFDSPIWRNRTRRMSTVPPELPPSDAKWNSYWLFKKTYPNEPMAMSAEAARLGDKLKRQMNLLRRRLRRANPGAGNAHCAPFHRVLSQLGLTYEPPVGDARELYGDVAPPMPAAAPAEPKDARQAAGTPVNA
jgi:hypothetical protein